MPCSDDDDDDILLDAPTFTNKRNAATKNRETKMLGYLDDCFAAEQVRQSKKQELFDMVKREREEVQCEGTQKHMRGSSQQRDSSEVMSNIGDTEGPCDKLSTTEREKDGKSLQTKSLSTMNDSPRAYKGIDRIDWNRVEAEYKSTGTEAKYLRRKILRDALDGLDEIPSSEEHNGGTGIGGSGTPPGGTPRAKRLARASVRATALSTNVGVRKAFFASRLDDTSTEMATPVSDLFCLFRTRSDAIAHFSSILRDIKEGRMINNRTTKRHQDGHYSVGCQHQKKDQLDAIVERLNDVVKNDLLPQYLYHQTLVKSVKKGFAATDTGVLIIPVELLSWLFWVACSGCRVGVDMSHGSFQTLRSLLVLTKHSKKNTSNQKELACNCQGLPATMNIDHFHTGLKLMFGLYMGAPTKQPCTGADKSPSLSDSFYSLGLKHYLEIWSTAISTHDCEQSFASSSLPSGTFDDAATAVLGVLVRISLDGTFHSGSTPLKSLQEMFLVTIDKVYNCFEKRLSKNPAFYGTAPAVNHVAEHMSMFLRWASLTASEIVDKISGLSAGGIGSADEDDTFGWLPLALAARNLPHCSDEGVVHAPCAILKALVAEEALKKYLIRNSSQRQEWIQRRDKLTRKCCNVADILTDNIFERMRWEAMSSAELGLIMVEEAGEEIKSNGPLFYAVVDICRICEEVGEALCPASIGTTALYSSNGSVLGSSDWAHSMYVHLDVMEQHCSTLKNSVTSVLSRPHLRRAKELLAWLSVTYRHYKNDAKKMSGNHKGSKIQHTMKSWMGQDLHDEDSTE